MNLQPVMPPPRGRTRVTLGLLTVAAFLAVGVGGRAALPVPAHIVIVMEENQDYGNIIGNTTDCPYINSLVSGAATFTQSFGDGYPSQPNYIELFSGGNQGVTNDNCPAAGSPYTVNNLGHQFLASHSFFGYAEGLPAVGSTTCRQTTYWRKHNPWVDWQGTGTNQIPSSKNVPFSSFPSTFSNLPTLSFVIPNTADDMHDGSTCALQRKNGDTWLKNNLAAYIAWCKSNNSLLILTWDTDANGSSCGSPTNGNRIATLVIGQPVKTGSYSEHIDHYSVLRTIEAMYGFTFIGKAATATTITDCWN